MKKLVCGVGINDSDHLTVTFGWVEVAAGRIARKITWFCPFYRRWKCMIERCYNGRIHATKPTYVGCTVCDEWLVFSKFKAWMETKDWQGKELDKDLMVSGNKVYSPDTCLFVSKLINTFIVGCECVGGAALVGGRYQVVFNNPLTKKQEGLGIFNSREEAREAWRKRKHEIACQLASQQTDERVANALMAKYLI